MIRRRCPGLADQPLLGGPGPHTIEAIRRACDESIERSRARRRRRRFGA